MKRVPLRPNERLVRVVRRHALTHAPQAFFAFLFFGAAFFFLFFLLRRGVWGQALLAGLLGVGAFLLARLLIVRAGNVCYLTSQRVIDIDRRGFFHRVVSEIPLGDIHDVSGEVRGFFGTLFRYGRVEVYAGEGMVRIVLDAVRRPEQVQSEINRLREAVRQRKMPFFIDEMLQWIAREADASALRRIDAALRKREKAMGL